MYVIANLPYYITTPIIIKLIEDDLNVDKIVVMVQKEVGDRFKATPGSKDYSSLSVFLGYYYNIKKLMDVSRNVFIPKPNVDSIVVEFSKKDSLLYLKDTQTFYKLIRDSFKQKRKTLKNNLKDYNLIKIEETLKCAEQIKEFGHRIYQEKDVFFLGRGIDETVAKESALKLKEISYIHADSYPAGELKHGPIALIENDITVISIMTDKNLVEKTVSNIQEVITRGAKTLVVTNQNIDDKMFDTVIHIPETNTFISPILSVIPLQLLADYISKEKGLDVDKPRNLAKSVTVE